MVTTGARSAGMGRDGRSSAGVVSCAWARTLREARRSNRSKSLAKSAVLESGAAGVDFDAEIIVKARDGDKKLLQKTSSVGVETRRDDVQ